jgi:hypothetical protein
VLALLCVPAWAQDAGDGDPAALIGLSLGELIGRYGAPVAVYAVRGREDWQDDVVFSYGEREFYFYKDRVWQVSVTRAYGIRIGENRNVIPLVMGEGTKVADGYSLAAAPPAEPRLSWPVQVRFNNDSRGLITAIFIYRSDF